MVYIISLFFFIGACALMSVGLLRGKAIRGSCGGIAVYGPDGEPLTCSTCPNRKKGKNVKYLKDGECLDSSNS